jgi:hypothetical protein
MLRVHLTADRPQCTGAALDPDDDALGAPTVVEPVDDAFGKAAMAARSLHAATIQSVSMGLVDAIKGAFSFLGSRSQSEERMAQYVIREHHRGRPVAEIVKDHYVTNRCTPAQIRRLLDRPDVLHHLGEDVAAHVKSEL